MNASTAVRPDLDIQRAIAEALANSSAVRRTIDALHDTAPSPADLKRVYR